MKTFKFCQFVISVFGVCCARSLIAATASYPVPTDSNADGIIDSSEIQAAVNLAQGVVFLPSANTYKIDAPVVISSRNGVSLVGEGPATVLPIVGNIEALSISGGYGCGVRNVKFVGSVSHSANTVSIAGGNEHFVENITIEDVFCGIQITDGIGPVISTVTIDGISGDYGIKVDGSGGTAKVDAAQLHDIRGENAGANVEWLLFGRVDGVQVLNSTFEGGKRGIRAYGTVGPKYVYTHEVEISSTSSEGIYIESGNDVLVNATQITDTGASGFRFGSTFIGGAILTDLNVDQAAGHGIQIDGGRDIGILEPIIQSTGSALPLGTGAGIQVSAGCSYVSVTDGSVQGEHYGVLYSGSESQSDSQDIKIKNVNLAGNSVPKWPANLEGTPSPIIVIDNTDPTRVALVGAWTPATTVAGYYGANYLGDGNTGGGKSATFAPSLSAGNYEVFLRWTANVNRADNVPVDVVHAGGTSNFTVNQELNNGVWISLGVFAFNSGTGGSVVIRNTGANGHVIADAVRFIPQ